VALVDGDFQIVELFCQNCKKSFKMRVFHIRDTDKAIINPNKCPTCKEPIMEGKPNAVS
jgi:formate dehydrogenase maturation protein FdhE